MYRNLKAERKFYAQIYGKKGIGFPGGSVVKYPPDNAGARGFNPWAGKIPWREKWQSTPVFLPEKKNKQTNIKTYIKDHKRVRHSRVWMCSMQQGISLNM